MLENGRISRPLRQESRGYSCRLFEFHHFDIPRTEQESRCVKNRTSKHKGVCAVVWCGVRVCVDGVLGGVHVRWCVCVCLCVVCSVWCVCALDSKLLSFC